MDTLKLFVESFVKGAILILSSIGCYAVLKEIGTPIIIGKVISFIVFSIVLVFEMRDLLNR